MNFVYPYLRSGDDWDILRSIEWINRAFPDATIYTVGHAVPGAKNIPHKKRYKDRGADVADKILTYCKQIGEDAVYMNDDFYINAEFNPHINIYRGNITRDSSHSLAYQEACNNTKQFLEFHGLTTLNYECHQPFMFSSQDMINLLESIEWHHCNLFIKSLYLNVYKADCIEGENLKLGKPDILRANMLLSKYGSFSTSQEFKTKKGCEYLLSKY
jgi:hypothetical protein